MKNLKNYCTIFVAFLAMTTFAQAQTVDGIVAKYLEATGGLDKWEGIDSYVVKHSYKANAATDFDEEVNVNVKSKQLSRKKTILQRDFFYVVDGKNGWLKIPMGSRDKAVTYTTKDLSEKEAAELSDEIKTGLLPFVNYAEKGFTANYAGEKVVEGKKTDQINLVRNGLKLEYYFDKETGLLNREVSTEDGVTTTIDHITYSTSKKGIKYPSVSVLVNSKDKKKTNLTTEWVFNSEIPSALFIK